MNRWALASVVVAILLLLGGGYAYLEYRKLMQPAAAAALDPAHAQTATRFLDLLDRSDFTAAHAMLDAQARAALSVEKLAEVWQTLPKQLGDRRRRDAARGVSVDGVPLVAFRIEFAMMPLDARIGIDAAGAIHTFRVVPIAATPAAPATADDPFIEREVAVAGLGGTLTLPRGSGPFPALLLVHGSGANDRDQTVGPNRPFLDLSRGLATQGIAVLRYEKRTRARPQDFTGKSFTVDDEVIDDAVAAIAVLRSEPGIDPTQVYLGGMSLGAMLVPRIALRSPQLAGLILLSGPARDLLEIVPQQVRYLAQLDGGIDAAEQSAIEDIDQQVAATRAHNIADAPRESLLLGLPASYWMDLRGYDPVEALRALPQRTLIVQGGRDYQVTPADDFARWQQAFSNDPRVSLRSYPQLNHLLIRGEGPPNPQEYMRSGNVEPQVIDQIAAWIEAPVAR